MIPTIDDEIKTLTSLLKEMQDELYRSKSGQLNKWMTSLYEIQSNLTSVNIQLRNINREQNHD